MPKVIDIENADVLTASEAARLLAAIRASEYYTTNQWKYPDLESTVKTRVNRKRAITDASNNSPIVIESEAHGFSTNETVTVQGVGGNSSANGVWLVASAAADTFELVGSVGSAAYTSGGEILDLVSQHLATIVATLDELGDGTVGIKGGKDGVDYSQTRDREALVAEALDTLYTANQAGGNWAFGQRGYADRICPRGGLF